VLSFRRIEVPCVVAPVSNKTSWPTLSLDLNNNSNVSGPVVGRGDNSSKDRLEPALFVNIAPVLSTESTLKL
jgi:hypothetical protein